MRVARELVVSAGALLALWVWIFGWVQPTAFGPLEVAQGAGTIFADGFELGSTCRWGGECPEELLFRADFEGGQLCEWSGQPCVSAVRLPTLCDLPRPGTPTFRVRLAVRGRDKHGDPAVAVCDSGSLSRDVWDATCASCSTCEIERIEWECE